MLRLRDDILQADYRLLYLAWLMGMPKALAYEEISEEHNEPPVPAGLGKLSGALNNFIKFFELDSALIRVGAETSGKQEAVSAEMLRQAIRQLPREECDEVLLRLATGDPHLSLEFKRRLQERIKLPQSQALPLRTVGYLLAAAEEERERERKRKAEEAERQRIKKLNNLAIREEQTWQRVERLIQQSQAKPYDQAVELLMNLKELAEYQGTQSRFRQRINQLISTYKRRSALMRRFEKVNLR